MERHLDILAQLLKYWWDNDNGTHWDSLSGKFKINVIHDFIYRNLKK